MNPNFLDYKMLGAKDMPKMTTILVETDEPLGPYGAKSISEVPSTGRLRQLPNAIFHAIGVRFRKLPIRPEDVLRALREKETVEVAQALVPAASRLIGTLAGRVRKSVPMSRDAAD